MAAPTQTGPQAAKGIHAQCVWEAVDRDLPTVDLFHEAGIAWPRCESALYWRRLSEAAWRHAPVAALGSIPGGGNRCTGNSRISPLTSEIIDIRRFDAQTFTPLLETESRVWNQELRWDFGPTSRIISKCLREMRLAGYALVSEGKPQGYCFFYYDGEKGLIGDLFLDPSAAGIDSAQRLLNHVLETLLGTPGLRRVESQLPHFAFETLEACFRSYGFRSYHRRFMFRTLGAPRQDPSSSISLEGGVGSPSRDGFSVLPWERAHDREAAELLYHTYRHHVDAGINDQYSSLAGTTRLIENIVLQQGCGEYLPRISRVVVHCPTQRLAGLLAVTAVRSHTAHIPQVAIPPPFQGRGLGTLLMESAFQDLAAQGFEEISLTVTDANAGAVRLYDRLGFKTFREFGAFVYQRR